MAVARIFWLNDNFGLHQIWVLESVGRKYERMQRNMCWEEAGFDLWVLYINRGKHCRRVLDVKDNVFGVFWTCCEFLVSIAIATLSYVCIVQSFQNVLLIPVCLPWTMLTFHLWWQNSWVCWPLTWVFSMIILFLFSGACKCSDWVSFILPT